MLLAITDLMPRLIFSLLWLWSKNTAPEHRQLEPIQDLNFKLGIQTKACRSLAILFFSIFHISNTKFVDRATKDCTSSHFQGHFLRIENDFESFWKWFSFGNVCLEKATFITNYLLMHLLYFFFKCAWRAISDRCTLT